VLIPSIDLMGGKIVQLVQGEQKALEFDNFTEWIERFAKYPLVQVIDLDAAMGTGENRKLIAEFCAQLPCQVGGGIRSTSDAHRVFTIGARKVIVGSSLIKNSSVDVAFAAKLSGDFGAEKLVAAVDSRGGQVAIHGWKTITDITPASVIAALEPQFSGFLYTHIDTEGLLQGIPMDVIRDLRTRTRRQLIAAGGIRSQQEIDELDAMGVDAVVGMAVYTGTIKP
jgi:phosphoribosylformimino-5-aminoimidazole carboxamide ribotide isomerase